MNVILLLYRTYPNLCDVLVHYSERVSRNKQSTSVKKSRNYSSACNANQMIFSSYKALYTRCPFPEGQYNHAMSDCNNIIKTLVQLARSILKYMEEYLRKILAKTYSEQQIVTRIMVTKDRERSCTGQDMTSLKP